LLYAYKKVYFPCRSVVQGICNWIWGEICPPCEGETVEEAISMMKEAAEGCIEIVGVNNIPYFKIGKVMVRKLELAPNV